MKILDKDFKQFKCVIRDKDNFATKTILRQSSVCWTFNHTWRPFTWAFIDMDFFFDVASTSNLSIIFKIFYEQFINKFVTIFNALWSSKLSPNFVFTNLVTNLSHNLPHNLVTIFGDIVTKFGERQICHQIPLSSFLNTSTHNCSASFRQTLPVYLPSHLGVRLLNRSGGGEADKKQGNTGEGHLASWAPHFNSSWLKHILMIC